MQSSPLLYSSHNLNKGIKVNIHVFSNKSGNSLLHNLNIKRIVETYLYLTSGVIPGRNTAGCRGATCISVYSQITSGLRNVVIVWT